MYIYTEWMFHEGAYVILINTTHWYVMYMIVHVQFFT